MIPRTHFLQCRKDDFPSLKQRLENEGYSVYDPVYDELYANVTFIRSADINHIALRMIGPGRDSDEEGA